MPSLEIGGEVLSTGRPWSAAVRSSAGREAKFLSAATPTTG
jgi:hypothetical protein